jgi:hypothetical protein
MTLPLGSKLGSYEVLSLVAVHLDPERRLPVLIPKAA